MKTITSLFRIPLMLLTVALLLSFSSAPPQSIDLTKGFSVMNAVIASGEVELFDLESYDFVSGERGYQIGGDLYVRTTNSDCFEFEAWANFPPQQGGFYLFSGFSGDLSDLNPAEMGLVDDDFSPFCVELIEGGLYVYKRHAKPGDYIIFRVEALAADLIRLSYIVTDTGLPESSSSQVADTPDSFTLPAGQHIDAYDGPGGQSSGSFQVELFFTVIEERDSFLHVSWDAANGSTYDAWVKRADVEIFLSGDYAECPFVFTMTDYTPQTFATPDGSPPKGVFSFDALVDLSSEPVTLQQTEATLQDASNILFNLTGFVIRLQNYGTVEFTQEQSSDYLMRDSIPQCYIAQTTNDIPDSLVIFSYGADNFARTMGGFTYAIEGPTSFKNHFVDAFGNDNQIYVMFNHYSHKYARCGYDEWGENVISDVSIGGECSNQPGTPCVMKNGYSMCQTAADDLYASTPNYFSAATVIHEIMHSFGYYANYDHYGTTDCTEEMKKGDSSWTPNDDEFLVVNGMCPYVYDNFIAGYRP